MMKKFLSRKFIIVEEVLLLAFVALLLDKMSDAIFATIAIAAMTAYGAANVYQKIKIKRSRQHD